MDKSGSHTQKQTVRKSRGSDNNNPRYKSGQQSRRDRRKAEQTKKQK